MQTQIQIMLELQDAINVRVSDDWRLKDFAWYRAIWTECAELMDHYGWKWWKQQTPDIEQVRLELIDIWHFGLSILLQNNFPVPSLLTQLEKAFTSPGRSNDFHEILESFTAYTLTEKDFSIPLYVALLQSVDMSFDELYCGYIGKNVLNFFRQDHGYQEGSYVKLWNGREDNEHLVELMAELNSADTQFTKKLYALLEERYKHGANRG